MRMLAFCKRNLKEILRDPLNLAFGLGFSLVLLLLLSAIGASAPVPMFQLDQLAPGVTVFGLAFLTLFSATLMAKDRQSALFLRLYTTPMEGRDFILGYTLPLLPIGLMQGVICYLAAFCMGLPITLSVLLAVLMLLPIALLFIGMGLIFGSILTDKQAGGICGALITNLTAWLSGIWFDPAMVGGVFATIADVLPFSHGVDLVRLALAGDIGAMVPHLLVVLGYALVLLMLGGWIFVHRQEKAF
ncbi:MAG: ABC transporter permease [Clostridiales bacterium]|nr:ABC transporter permease [Clostridiales bacterium]